MTIFDIPRTKGFAERFNRTVLDEFFRETFRKKFYASVEELQKDLDQWVHYYNITTMNGRTEAVATWENSRLKPLKKVRLSKSK